MTSDNKNEEQNMHAETKYLGKDHYPERGDNDQNQTSKLSFSFYQHLACENRIMTLFKANNFARLFASALETSGCPLDLKRHVVCEPCDPSVSGGYDQTTNQIVICQNVATSYGRVSNAMAHEMIHMFDYCRNHMEIDNLEHLACTEIRAGNLTGCSYLSHSFTTSDFFSVKKQHAVCVKSKAVASMMAARNVPKEEAEKIVDKVFDRCYNDLEPLGKRPLRPEQDSQNAMDQRKIYGYYSSRYL